MTAAPLITDQEFADLLKVDLEDFHVLRKRYSWPCVKVGRFKFRFTEEQVAEIIELQSTSSTASAASRRRAVAAAATPAAFKISGQTKRSAARRRSA